MDNLLFTNSFGCVYMDKIYIKERDLEINLSYIKSFSFFSYKRSKIRLYILIISIFSASLFVITSEILFVIIALVFILTGLLFFSEKYCLEIYTTNINDSFLFEIKKKDVKNVEIFLNEVTKYSNKIELNSEI